jgi:hypothetical protein
MCDEEYVGLCAGRRRHARIVCACVAVTFVLKSTTSIGVSRALISTTKPATTAAAMRIEGMTDGRASVPLEGEGFCSPVNLTGN